MISRTHSTSTGLPRARGIQCGCHMPLLYRELTVCPQAYDELEESDAVVAVFVEATEQAGGGLLIWQTKVLSELPQSHHATARRVHLLGHGEGEDIQRATSFAFYTFIWWSLLLMLFVAVDIGVCVVS